MQLNQLLSRAFSILALSAAGLLAASASAQTQNYIELTPPQPSDTAGKVEVLEFFAYTCPHCKTMEPLVANWAKTLPDNVVVRPVPVAFNASMADLQRMYYTLESLDRLDLHNAFFRAIHDERKRLFDAKAMAAWAAEQGIDNQTFEGVFKSFGVNTKVSRANELAKAYKVEGTPTLVIGGRYVTSPSMNSSYEATITQAQALLDRVLKN